MNDVRYQTASEAWSAKRRGTAAGVGGLVLIAVGVIFSLRDWLPDGVTTILALLGLATLIYGVAVGVQIVLEREPDE